MVSLAQLWLPILLSAVGVFFASFLAWMVVGHHRSDWGKLPDQDGLIAALKQNRPVPGQYMFPYCARPEDRNDPAFKKQWEEGPSGTLTIMKPGGAQMGKGLALQFLHCLVVAIFVAYLAGSTLAPGAAYLAVCRVAGTAAILAWCGSVATESIWMGKPWRVSVKDIVDGVVYGLLTGAIFGWLWP